MKNVTIKDVAKAAGVSYSTVSRALTGSPEISEETRSRILQLCKDMNYTANIISTGRPAPEATTSSFATLPGILSRSGSSLSS